MATLLLAGGCFWCTEAAFEQLAGVSDVTSGYAGGAKETANYKRVCDGDTGHAEAVRIEFDPAQVGFDDLLEIFFATHDPCTLNRQGNDVGTQYRSAIFTTTPEQDTAARAKIAALANEGAFDEPIVTEVEPATTFWPAEAYHANYFARNGAQPYCRMVVGPKVAKFRSAFAGRRKGN